MLKKIKLPLTLSATVIISGCSLDAYIEKFKDYLYLMDPSIKPSNICLNHHYYEANDLPDDIEREFNGNITYFFWYGSDESRKADKALTRVKSIFSDDHISITRLPAINDDKWLDAANWSIALTSMGIGSNQDIIDLSYGYFAEEVSMEEFDHKIMKKGKSPHLFDELKFASGNNEEIMRIGDLTFLPGTEKIPAIMINSTHIVYPSDFNDMRDAWIAARYIYDNSPDLSSACQK